MHDDPRPGFNALRAAMLNHVTLHRDAKPEDLAHGLANMAFEALYRPAAAEERVAREAFEAGRRSRGLARAGNGEYRNTFLQEEWEVWLEAWQAGRAALAAPKAEAPSRSVAVFAPPDDVALLKAYSRASKGLQLVGQERAKFLHYARIGIAADRARNKPTSPAPQEESHD